MILKSKRLSLFLVALFLVAGAGCMPDIQTDGVPQSLEFDPNTGRVPEPIFLVQDPATGVIDLSLAGVDVPEDCSTLDPLMIAECEFNQYLQSLNGFPTMTPAKTPLTMPVDPAAAVAFVKILDAVTGKPIDDVAMGYDEAKGYLTFDPAKGWPLGAKVVIAVKGYDNGIKGIGGEEFAGSVVFNLLRRDESLTCGASKADDVLPSCKFYAVLEGESGANTGADLLLLEGIRQLYQAFNVFGTLENAGLEREQTAVAWAFSTHTAPVVELDPTKGLAPTISGPSELRVAFKGTLDADTVTPWSLAKTDGTIFLLDLTALAAQDMVNGMPPFELAIDGQEMVLTTKKPLVAGNMYGILITNKVADDKGNGLVPSPVTVLLRASGTLLNEGKSTVSSISDEQAVELEEGRATLAVLLNDALFAQLTKLTRADLAFVYALTVPAQEGGN